MHSFKSNKITIEKLAIDPKMLQMKFLQRSQQGWAALCCIVKVTAGKSPIMHWYYIYIWVEMMRVDVMECK